MNLPSGSIYIGHLLDEDIIGRRRAVVIVIIAIIRRIGGRLFQYMAESEGCVVGIEVVDKEGVVSPMNTSHWSIILILLFISIKREIRNYK